MANCILCSKKTNFLTRVRYSELEGDVCSTCANHINALRVCYFGAEQSFSHIEYLQKLIADINSDDGRAFISTELTNHSNHQPTTTDLFVEDTIKTTPICTSNFKLVDGLPNLPKNILVITAELYSDSIFFWQAAKPQQQQSPIILKTKTILSVEYMTEKEIIEKSKSVTGRAAAGALLFGPVGAIIGGMSGISNTKKAKTHLYYIIHYTNSQGDEAIITLEVGCMGCHDSTFNKALKTVLPSSNNTPTFL